MKSVRNDGFAEMKNEDRKFGERFNGKSVSSKRQKHRVDYKNFSPNDLKNLNQDQDVDEVELEDQL